MATDSRNGGHGALANTGFALAAQATTSVFTAALTLYLVRALGPSSYGVFGLALAIGTIALLLADLGVSQSVARFIAEVRDDRTAVAGLLADALRLKLAISATVAILLIAVAGPISAAYDQPSLAWVLRGVALAMFGQSVMALYMTAFMALGRIDRNVRVILYESATEATASIALVALGAGAAGAAFGRAIGYGVGAVAAVAVATTLCGRPALALRRRADARTDEIAGYALPLLVTNSAYTLYATVDVLLIGALLTSTAIGLFSAPMRLVTFLGSVGQAVANAVAPRLARQGDQPPDVQTFRASVRWLVIFQSLTLAPVLVWAEPIVVLLLGPDFRGSAPVLRALAPYVLLLGVASLITTGVNYLGQAGRRVPIVVGALAINVVIDLALLRQIGVVGAAIGTSAAYLVYVPAHMVLLRKAIEFPLRPLVLTLVRCVAAAAAMAAILALLGTRSLTPAEWSVGVVMGPTAFIAVLVATGELRLEELSALRARVAGIMGRRGK